MQDVQDTRFLVLSQVTAVIHSRIGSRVVCRDHGVALVDADGMLARAVNCRRRGQYLQYR